MSGEAAPAWARRVSTAALALCAALRATAQTAPAPQPAPMTLAAATNTALQQVSAFRQAQIDEALAVQDLRQARAALLPRARDAFSITYNTPERGANPPAPSFIAANAVHEYQNLLGVTGEWSLGLLAAVRRSRALLDAARAGTEVARRALVRGVAEGYYGAALATAKRVAAEQSLAAAEEFERVTCLNYQAGEVPEVDCIRARLQTAARRDDLLQARQQETIANASLATLLGAGLDEPPAIEALPQAIDPASIDRLGAAGARRRPELAQADAQLRAARAGISVARADFLPKVTYSLDKGFDTDSLQHDELARHRGTLATATVDVPLFDWGATVSKWRQAQLQAQAAEQQRQLLARDLDLQFATARQEALTAVQRVDNARRAMDDAERNVTISIARYRAGEGPVTEATEAQATRAQQRLALQQALFDYQVALAHLREAAGE